MKLASYVDRELRRMMNRVVPVALPVPEELPQPKTGVRPDVGPVVPLTAAGTDDSGDLLGANGHPAQVTADPVATKVLSRGDPIPAPAGRADHFSWPRPGGDTNAAPDVPPQPVSLAPTAPAKKGAPAGDGRRDQPTPTRTRSQSRSLSASPSRSSRRPAGFDFPSQPVEVYPFKAQQSVGDDHSARISAIDRS